MDGCNQGTLPTEITFCQTSQVKWYIFGQFPKLAMISSKQVNNEQVIFNKACCGWSGQGKLENKLDRRKLSDFSILEEILLVNKICLFMDVYYLFCVKVMHMLETYDGFQGNN